LEIDRLAGLEIDLEHHRLSAVIQHYDSLSSPSSRG
jgi:hypothetical protein